jgi:hypothetical protein
MNNGRVLCQFPDVRIWYGRFPQSKAGSIATGLYAAAHLARRHNAPSISGGDHHPFVDDRHFWIDPKRPDACAKE